MFTSFIKLQELVFVLNKYDFTELEKEGHAKLIIATGADFYANKSLLAYLGGENYKTSDVEKELPQMLENFDKKMLNVGKSMRDGSISYGVAFILLGKFYSYEKGIEFLANRKSRVSK